MEIGMVINKICLRNIKGKDYWELNFNNLCANKINLFVAPNGTGKSTLTAAFSAVSHGKMKLGKHDYFKNDQSNQPSLTIDFTEGKNHKEVTSDPTSGEISKAFKIFVINSQIYAKPTSRITPEFNNSSAELYIKDIEVCQIPAKFEIPYSYQCEKQKFGNLTPNLNKTLSWQTCLNFLYEHRSEFKACVNSKKLNTMFEHLNSENIEDILLRINADKTLSHLLSRISELFHLSTPEDAVRYFIQFADIFKNHDIKQIKAAADWQNYTEFRRILNTRLSDFDSTSLHITSKKNKEHLIIQFGRAAHMSNGERDVLCFISLLAKAEVMISATPMILIMDEIFDYLDGSNLLAVQYYLSTFIETVKSNQQIIIPIIMTHLDPEVFSNYYFKKPAIHYLTNKKASANDHRILKLLNLRSTLKINKDAQGEELEKYYLHYHPASHSLSLSSAITEQLLKDLWSDSLTFRNYCYDEVKKYTGNQDYDVLAVIIGLRIKVEELTYSKLSEPQRKSYLEQHGSKAKLQYAEECGLHLPELFYFLQPLYNDPAHLYGGNDKDDISLNKIKGAYLKLSSSRVIRKLISNVFCLDSV